MDDEGGIIILIVGSNNINRCDYLDLRTIHTRVFVIDEIKTDPSMTVALSGNHVTPINNMIGQAVISYDILLLAFYDRDEYRVLGIYLDEHTILHDLEYLDKAFRKKADVYGLNSVSFGVECSTLTQLKNILNEVCDNFFENHPDLKEVDSPEDTLRLDIINRIKPNDKHHVSHLETTSSKMEYDEFAERLLAHGFKDKDLESILPIGKERKLSEKEEE